MTITRSAMLAITIAVPVLAQARGSSSDLGSGQASYYSNEFAGKRTASGEIFNPKAMTAAHRTAPFGSHIRVTNLRNNRNVVVRINDRGPWKKGRIIDVSYAAAKQIGMHHSGTARVQLTMVGK
jgi:rare lipoprotein A